MAHSRSVFVAGLTLYVTMLVGCGSSRQELPSKEKIQQQLQRDAAMRAAEDRLEKESSSAAKR